MSQFDESGSPTAAGVGTVLVFSKTSGYRHESIPDGIAAIQRLGEQHGFDVDTTEDAAVFGDGRMARYDAVVFLHTSGTVLDDEQRGGLQRYVRSGGGYVGVHAASGTEYDWPWYGELVGAFFDAHPEIQQGVVEIEDATHLSTAHLPAQWVRTDEWYNFRTNPREHVHVLATADESTFAGGTMGGDHPIAWCRPFEGGRSWYTGLGHTAQSYTEPAFVQHLWGGIRYAAGADGS